MIVPDLSFLEKYILIEGNSTTHNYGEAENRKWKQVVFAPGRFQPIHAGHEDMMRELIKFGRKMKAEPIIVIIAGSSISSKNPLSGEARKRYLRPIFKGVSIIVADNPFKAVESMFDKGIKPVGIIAGSDRAKSYKQLGLYYNITGFKVGSLTRDPDAKGSSSFSASKVRDAASQGRFKKDKKNLGFLDMMPKKMDKKSAERMYNEVRRGMGVK